MSDGSAASAGLLIGLLVVTGVLILGPIASDWGRADIHPPRSTMRLARATTVIFGFLTVGFVVAVVAFQPLQTVLIGLNAILTGVASWMLRRRAKASELEAAKD